MPELPPLMAGIYRHYRGPLYQVLGYGHDSNHEGRMVVIYIGLQLDGAKTGPRLAVRTADDFFAMVHPEDGTSCTAFTTHPACRDSVRRFTYVGPSWQLAAGGDHA